MLAVQDFTINIGGALELNVTFYRFPTVPLLTTWYEKSAANFRFAVKAPRLITHYKKFIDTDRLMDDFYRTVDLGLKEKCGCCLFQLPPNYHYSEERLEKIISSLHKDFNNVMEFRHESWWQVVVNDINTNAVYNAKAFNEILKRPHS